MSANFYKTAIEKFISETYVFDEEGPRAPESAFAALEETLLTDAPDVVALRHELTTMTILRDAAVQRAETLEKAVDIWRRVAERLEADNP